MRTGTNLSLLLAAFAMIAAAAPLPAAAQEPEPATRPDETATPETATPETATPETATPETATPETATPETVSSAPGDPAEAVTTARDQAAADVAAAEAAPALSLEGKSADETAATESPEAATDPAAAPSDAVRRVVGWVSGSGDNAGLPFVVIDKLAAEVFVFGPDAGLLGAAPALIGAAAGDDSPPGIGDRALSTIGPQEKITPAGRFVAAFGPAAGGHRVLWVDYDTAISLHPVVTANKKERRLARLTSPKPDDNRITYGCINVPAAFYENLVRPLFAGATGVVYILPDTRPLDEVFPSVHAQAEPAESTPAL